MLKYKENTPIKELAIQLDNFVPSTLAFLSHSKMAEDFSSSSSKPAI